MEEIKIEIGEYVRTKNGYILKNTIKDHKHIIDGIINQNEKYKYEFDNIVKHSKNIIDLIKEGDYVNLERIMDITEDYIRTTETIHNRFWLSNNIKSIVTKERFEQMEYRLEE